MRRDVLFRGGAQRICLRLAAPLRDCLREVCEQAGEPENDQRERVAARRVRNASKDEREPRVRLSEWRRDRRAA